MCQRIRLLVVFFSVLLVVSANNGNKQKKRQLDFGDSDLSSYSDSAVMKIELKTEDAAKIKDGEVEEIKITRKIPVPVPVTVEKRVPVAVPVHVDQPFPVYIPKPVPFAVHKPYPIPVQVPVAKPYISENGPVQNYHQPKLPQLPPKLPQPPPKLPLAKPPLANSPLTLLRRLVNTIKNKLNPLAHANKLHHHPPPKPVIKHVPVPYPVEKVVPLPVEVPVPYKVKEYVPVSFHSTTESFKNPHPNGWPENNSNGGNNFYNGLQQSINYRSPYSLSTEHYTQAKPSNPYDQNRDVSKIQQYYRNLFNFPSQLSHQKYSLTKPLPKFVRLPETNDNKSHLPNYHTTSPELPAQVYIHHSSSETPVQNHQNYGQESSVPTEYHYQQTDEHVFQNHHFDSAQHGNNHHSEDSQIHHPNEYIRYESSLEQNNYNSQNNNILDSTQHQNILDSSHHQYNLDPSQHQFDIDSSRQNILDSSKHQYNLESSQHQFNLDSSHQNILDSSKHQYNLESSQHRFNLDSSNKNILDSSQHQYNLDSSQHQFNLDSSHKSILDLSQHQYNLDSSHQNIFDNSHKNIYESPQHQYNLDSSQYQNIPDPSQHQQILDPSQHQQILDPSQHQQILDSTQHQQILDSTQYQQILDSTQHQQILDSSQHQNMFDSLQKQNYLATPSYEINHVLTSHPQYHHNLNYSSSSQQQVTTDIPYNHVPSKTTQYQTGYSPSQPPSHQALSQPLYKNRVQHFHYNLRVPTAHASVNKFQSPIVENYHYNYYVPVAEPKIPKYETVHYGKPKNLEYTTKHVNPNDLHYLVYMPTKSQIESYKDNSYNPYRSFNRSYEEKHDDGFYPTFPDGQDETKDDNFDYLQSFVTEPNYNFDSNIDITAEYKKNNSFTVEGPLRDQKYNPGLVPGIDPFQYVRYAPAIRPVAEHSFTYSVSTEPTPVKSPEKTFQSIEDYVSALSFAKAMPPSAPQSSLIPKLLLPQGMTNDSFTNGH